MSEADQIMEDALKARRNVYVGGLLVALLMWAVVYGVGSRLNGPLIGVDIAPEVALAGAAGFCVLPALFVASMKPRLADQIIDQARTREAAGAPPLTLRTMGRQLSLMGVGLGWSVLTAGYVAVGLTGLYATYSAFVLLAVVIAGAAGARVGQLLDYAEQMGVTD